MMNYRFPLPLQGIIPPMATPLTASGGLDEEGTERLIAHLLSAPVAGIFLLGTTGEGLSLSLPIREELIWRTCLQVGGRIPIIVGISSTCLADSLQMARLAFESGADAAVAMPPFCILPTQSELLEYLGALTAHLPLPLFLYNFPAITTVAWELDTVRHAMQNPKILGIKDSSGDLIYFQQLCELGRQRPDWTVLMGPEELLIPAIQAGGHGGICGGANVFPQFYAALQKAARTGNEQRLGKLLPLAQKIQALLFPTGCSIGDGVRRIKSALACLGLCGDATAPPLRRASAEERKIMSPQLAALSREIAAALAQSVPAPLKGTHFQKSGVKL